MDLYVNDTVLKVSQSLYFFTTSVSHGVENYFPMLWGTGISDAIFFLSLFYTEFVLNCFILFHIFIKSEVLTGYKYEMN